MLDVTLHTWDVVEALGLKQPILLGHSMGGMIAAEMAAIAPQRCIETCADLRRRSCGSPTTRSPDIFATMPYDYPALLFHDVEAGTAMLTAGLALDDPEWLKGFLVTNARQLGMAGKLLFPVPDRGLAQRLYRIKAKTLLIWGDSDKLISPVYGQAFAKAIKGSELVSIPEAGHMVTVEKPDLVMAALARLG